MSNITVKIGKPTAEALMPTDLVDGSGGRSAGPFSRLGSQSTGLIFRAPLSAKAEVQRGRAKALAAVQDLERNNEMVRGGMDRKAHQVVGASFFPVPTPDLRWLGQDISWALEYRQAARSVWNEWGNDNRMLCDGEGHYKISGLLWQAFRTLMSADAEVAGYIGYDRERADRFGHKWATYVKLIDPSRIQTPTDRLDDDGSIFQGRELDKDGRMIGFHVSNSYPTDGGLGANEFEYIPRETDWGRPQGFHWFFKRRAALNRAISPLVASIQSFEDYGTLDRSLLESAAVNTVISSYIKTTMDPEVMRNYLSPVEEGGPSVFDLKLDAYDTMGLKIGNKRIPVLGPNDEIVMENLKGSLVDTDAFRKSYIRNFASAMGMSVESFSLDYTDSTYSSIRASALNAMLQIDFERRMFADHVACMIFDALIEEAFALKILKAPAGAPSFYEARAAYTACRWIGPGMGWVDPLKEAKGATERWVLGAETLDSIAGAQGADVLDNIMNKGMEIKLMKQNDVPVPGPQTLAQAEADEASANEDPDASDGEKKKPKGKKDADGDGVVNEKEE